MPENNERPEESQLPEGGRGAAFAASIDKFFEEVTRGVVEAQRDLDAKSEAYLRNRSAISMPAVFRIPRVSAEFTLNAERSSSGGINFVVSSSSGRRDALQQKVSFDIVSVPPSVDELAATAPSAPGAPTGGGVAEVFEQVPEEASSSEQAEGETGEPAPAGSIDANASRDAGTEEANPEAFSLSEVVMALAKVQDREDTKYDEHEIARQLILNKDSLLLIDHPTHPFVLYAPDSQQEGSRDLVMAVIDRTGEESIPEVYSTDKQHTQEARRFQAIVQRLAELAAEYGRR